MSSHKEGGDEQGAASNASNGFVCIPCRQAHSLCDRKQPCGRCVQMGCGEACLPTPTRKRGRRTNYERGLAGDNPAPTKRLAGCVAPTPPQPAAAFIPGGTVLLPRGAMPTPMTTPLPLPLPAATPAKTIGHAVGHKSNKEDNRDQVDSTLTKTMLCVLMDQMRDVRHDNQRLQDEVGKLRTQREKSDRQMHEIRATVQEMAEAQRESATQLRALMTLFQQQQQQTSPASPSFLLSAAPPPPQQRLALGHSALSPELLETLPFLADCDASQSIVYDMSQAFITFRVNTVASCTKVAHPMLDYVSPAACAFLGYEASELIGRPLYEFGGMDVEGKLELVQAMMEVPSSKLARPVTISSSFRRRHRPPVRIETQHQNIWIEALPRWHVIVLKRVLEEGVPPPGPSRSMYELLADPLTRGVIDARLTFLSRTRSLAEIHPFWRSRVVDLSIASPRNELSVSPVVTAAAWDRYTRSTWSTPTSSSSSSSTTVSPSSLSPYSSSSSSPSCASASQDGDDDAAAAPPPALFLPPSPTHHYAAADQLQLQLPNAYEPAAQEGFDLDELLGTLRSPSSSVLDDPARWLQAYGASP